MVIKAISIFFSVHIIVIMLYELFKPTVLNFTQQFNGTSISLISKIEETLDLQIHGLSKYMIFIFTATLYYTIEMKRHDCERIPLLFEDISRLDADKSLVKLVKYLLNYGFYKFGIDAILMVMLTLLCSKMDLLSLFYIPTFILFTFKKRQSLESCCKFASNLTLILIIVQLVILVILRLQEFNDFYVAEIIKFILHMVITNLKKSPFKLVFDYILLMMLSCQQSVFKISRQIDFSQDPFKYGGENDSTLLPKKISNVYIYKHQLYSFPEKIETLMDLIKRYVFKIQFWLTIAIIFFAGTNHVDIFSLCYILWSFVFLWQGTEFYLKTSSVLWRQWNLLLTYSIIVIVFKVFVKTLTCACGKIIPDDHCFLLAIFDVSCSSEDSIKCKDLVKKKGFHWDVLAFFFIIAQRRIFQSYYFYNVKQDTRITNIMASRGAKLNEELRIQEMNKSVNEEKAHLENLWLKMEKIKKMAAFRNRKRNITNHDLAIRSGDIYMFINDFDTAKEELTDEISKKSTALISSKPRASEDDDFFDIEIEVSSEKSKEKIVLDDDPTKKEDIQENDFLRFFHNIFRKIHARSRNHTYIIKLLSQEKKYLMDLLEPPVCEEEQ